MNAGKEVSFEAGKTIIEEGSGGAAFLLILEGSVEVRRRGKSIAKLGKGQFFGEMSLLDHRPRSADVIAVEPPEGAFQRKWGGADKQVDGQTMLLLAGNRPSIPYSPEDLEAVAEYMKERVKERLKAEG